MFSNPVRLILIIVCAIVGFYNIYKGDAFSGVLIFAAAFFIVYGYFRYGAVHSAFQKLQKGRDAEAEHLLNSIKYPNLLTKYQKAYYFFGKAALQQNKNNINEAEKLYIQALEIGLRTTNDEALVNLNLAKIYQQKNDPRTARERLEKATDLPHKPEVEEEIQNMKTNLQQ